MLVDDLIDKTDFDVFGITHASDAFKDEQEIIRTGIPIIGKEEREDWPDGRIAWVSTSKMPFYDKEDKLSAHSVYQEISRLKKELNKARKRFSNIGNCIYFAGYAIVI